MNSNDPHAKDNEEDTNDQDANALGYVKTQCCTEYEDKAVNTDSQNEVVALLMVKMKLFSC